MRTPDEIEWATLEIQRIGERFLQQNKLADSAIERRLNDVGNAIEKADNGANKDRQEPVD